jgi:DNA-binding transcriptional regulator YiaG
MSPQKNSLVDALVQRSVKAKPTMTSLLSHGQRIIRFRSKHQMSQKSFAVTFGLHTMTVSKIERDITSLPTLQLYLFNLVENSERIWNNYFFLDPSYLVKLLRLASPTERPKAKLVDKILSPTGR